MSDYTLLKCLLEKDRSIRRCSGKEVEEETLKELIDLVRYCASGRNLQPLKYRLVFNKKECEAVFPLLSWAGYLPDWDGPQESERPVAYLVQCLDTRLTQNCLCDDGLQLQALTLGAVAKGLGCCIIKSFKVSALEEVLDIPEWAEPQYVLALGYPVEKVELETTDGSLNADIKYYRDANQVHHVPKRPLSELLL